MKTEAWLKRKIELKEQLVTITLEEIGDLTRELLIIQGKETNGHGKSLNCAPINDRAWETERRIKVDGKPCP